MQANALITSPLPDPTLSHFRLSIARFLNRGKHCTPLRFTAYIHNHFKAAESPQACSFAIDTPLLFKVMIKSTLDFFFEVQAKSKRGSQQIQFSVSGACKKAGERGLRSCLRWQSEIVPSYILEGSQWHRTYGSPVCRQLSQEIHSCVPALTEQKVTDRTAAP